MRLSWAALEWPIFRERYALTAFGGLVVTTALFLMTKLAFWPFVQTNAETAFSELLTTVTLNPFVLLCVLVLFLVFLVLSGAPLTDLLAKLGLTSATEFCKDAAFVGTGIWLGFLLTLQAPWALCLQNVFWLAVVAFVLHGTKAIVHTYALPLTHADSTPRRDRLIVSSVALTTLVILYLFL
ncbi:MAG: hypothetical protein Q8K14_03205 [Hydrogenophaga sp.]|uniref:hypothetical protein n=1 Tax=Hydrogenophaga sp. TaxID=1904254 RepID=UPI0027303223|nr:hypothetical protein [Hydrogenophaga sp.]MDP2249423.1 hypothetical protein [Hydrogenophaga sp.]